MLSYSPGEGVFPEPSPSLTHGTSSDSLDQAPASLMDPAGEAQPSPLLSVLRSRSTSIPRVRGETGEEQGSSTRSRESAFGGSTELWESRSRLP